MSRRSFLIRTVILAVLFLLATLFLLTTLQQLQDGDEEGSTILHSTQTDTVRRTETVPAARGEIFDRNGVALVSNTAAYSVCFDYYTWQRDEQCHTIARVLELLREHNISYTDGLPITGYPYQFTEADSRELSDWLESLEIDNTLPAPAVMAALEAHFDVPASFPQDTARAVLGVLFDMYRYNFSYLNPFTLAVGVDASLLSVIAEREYLFPGVTGRMQYDRVYNISHAAHILGRVGQIFAEEYDEYKAKGYPMNAIVGKDGAEKAFEA